jgi:hypothetical protein
MCLWVAYHKISVVEKNVRSTTWKPQIGHATFVMGPNPEAASGGRGATSDGGTVAQRQQEKAQHQHQ